MTPVGHPLKNRTFSPANLDLVPTNLRHFEAVHGKSHHLPPKNGEPFLRSSFFFTALKQRLISQANPKEWLSALNESDQFIKKILLPKISDAVSKRPDAGQ
jgi:hypothetical protein